jgi:UDP-2,4-diacetamido-2,4,6-trideoxy-beta-L-altropyranose hydrolase
MRVAVRADASPVMGAGHVMRCLSLADGLRRRGASVSFVSRSLPGHLATLVSERGHEVLDIGAADAAPGSAGAATGGDLSHSGWLPTTQATDAADTARALGAARCDWLVVDHYALDARWETALRATASRLLVIDDLADRAHDCDVLLDQNLHAEAAPRYAGRVPPGCELLLGPQFALLRREFRPARAEAAARAGDVSRLLVSFGGADASSSTVVAIEAVAAALPTLTQVDVVIGADHAHRDAIQQACARHGYRCHVQTDRMAELMAAADLAIGAGGVTTWERCCVGLPAVVAAVAGNQVDVVEQAARHGLVYALDGPLSADRLGLHLRALVDNPSLRHRMSRAALATVDGLGVDRTVQAMGLDEIQVREAAAGDARPMFEWRNHESVRRMSRQPAPVTWAEHEAWLTAVAADANRILLIGEHRGRPVGVVRFDLDAAHAEVSIYRVPASDGRGLGTRLLRAAERWLAARRPEVVRLTAEVLEGNERSHRLFRSAGYQARSRVYEKRVHA